MQTSALSSKDLSITLCLRFSAKITLYSLTSSTCLSSHSADAIYIFLPFKSVK